MLEIPTQSLEEKVKLLIFRDLMRLGWQVDFSLEMAKVVPPEYYDKEVIKESMSYKRQEILRRDSVWISNHLALARQNLADGTDVLASKIKPVVEICETQDQHNLFRILRHYWSSPYSDYVGRRIKLLIRDNGLHSKPIIGIAALGSSIIHIPERDQWIGWDTATRTNNIIYTMDAYVVGALPPYNHLLGGKLISYILASKEVRQLYKKRYQHQITEQKQRKAIDLACFFTTSLYGRSSQYNRLKYDDRLLFQPIGQTKGYGTLHLTNETFAAMRALLELYKVNVTNRFGDGPVWRMRVIREVGKVLGFDSDFLLQHSFRRNIYVTPLAENYIEFLIGKEKKLKYYRDSMKDLTGFWRTRWLHKRQENSEVLALVKDCKAKNFDILGTIQAQNLKTNRKIPIERSGPLEVISKRSHTRF
jgi:hypothetical protein